MENKSFRFNCPCKSCIMSEVSKLQQKKLYEEADTVLFQAIKYYSQFLKELEDEREKLHAATKQTTMLLSIENTPRDISENVDSIPCIYNSQYKNNIVSIFSRNIKHNREISCPVAIFDNLPNPKQKPMYPKNLVYADGKDIQLEEIRAAVYWENMKKESVQNQSKSTEQKEVTQKDISRKTFNENGVTEENAEKTIKLKNFDISNSIHEEHIISKKNDIKDISESETYVKKIEYNEKFGVVSPQKISQIGINIMYEKTEDILKQTNAEIIHEKKKVDHPEKHKFNIIEKKKLHKVHPFTKLNQENIPLQDNSEETENEAKCNFIDDISAVLERLWPSPVMLNDPANINRSNEKVETIIVSKEKTELSVVCAHNNNNEKTKMSPVWNDEEENLDVSANTCTTKAFSLMLPSSTPNRRKSQLFDFFNTNKSDNGETKSFLEHVRQSTAGITVPNLSMILEMSKERFSSSCSGSTMNNVINSKTFTLPEEKPLSVISETVKKSDNIYSKLPNFSDPFNPDLIEYFLSKIKFPSRKYLDGFCHIDGNMPLTKLSSTINLGSEKYTMIGEIGRGNYAKVIKAKVSGKSNYVSLKLQKPACLWEYYISKKIHERLNSTEKSQYFIDYSNIYIYKNGSILLSSWAPYGSLLNFVNNLKILNNRQFRCNNAVSTYLSIQLISAIQYLHSCQIIHGDVKPDNFVICCSITNTKPCIQLIDYGRSIDMSLYPKDTEFCKVVTTEDFTCNEMKEKRPWTYQIDLFGLAGTIYVLLTGEYMKTIKQDSVWILKKPLPRYMNKDIWDPIFEKLLNIPSCYDLPDLSALKQKLQLFYNKMDKFTINYQFNSVFKMLK